MTVLAFYFGWPLGAVWSNLLASAICAGLVWWQMTQAERHHRELKAHITKTAAEEGGI